MSLIDKLNNAQLDEMRKVKHTRQFFVQQGVLGVIITSNKKKVQGKQRPKWAKKCFIACCLKSSLDLIRFKAEKRKKCMSWVNYDTQHVSSCTALIALSSFISCLRNIFVSVCLYKFQLWSVRTTPEHHIGYDSEQHVVETHTLSFTHSSISSIFFYFQPLFSFPSSYFSISYPIPYTKHAARLLQLQFLIMPPLSPSPLVWPLLLLQVSFVPTCLLLFTTTPTQQLNCPAFNHYSWFCTSSPSGYKTCRFYNFSFFYVSIILCLVLCLFGMFGRFLFYIPIV